MRNLWSAFAVCCFVVAVATWTSGREALTEQAQTGWTGYGLGSEGCGKYLEQRRVPNSVYDAMIGSWFYGFISAYNYYGPRPVRNDLDQETVLAYLDKYCRDAPLASVAVGALQLVKVYAR